MLRHVRWIALLWCCLGAAVGLAQVPPNQPSAVGVAEVESKDTTPIDRKLSTESQATPAAPRALPRATTGSAGESADPVGKESQSSPASAAEPSSAAAAPSTARKQSQQQIERAAANSAPAARAPVASAASPEVVAVLHAPSGGRPFSIADIGVVCGPIPGPFRSLSGGRWIGPPSEDSAIGQVYDVPIAATSDGCSKTSQRILAIAVGPRPHLQVDSLVWSPDEGRADASGRNLRGSVLFFRTGDEEGSDVCPSPTGEGGEERCSWSIGKSASADPDQTVVGLYPRGARPGAKARFYDERGRALPDTAPRYKPAKIVLQQVLPQEPSVDLAAGQGQVPLLHSEAVAAAECAPLTCEVSGGELVVRGGAAPVDNLHVTLRLRPRVMLKQGDRLRSQASASVAVLHCPMSIVSGEPFRGNDDAAAVVKLSGLCARDVPQLDFRAQRRRVKVLGIYPADDGTLVHLGLGAIHAEQAVITASRRGPPAVVVAVASMATRPVPALRAVIDVPGFPNVDFVPQNRWAFVHVPPPADNVEVVALSIPGVYEARVVDGRNEVRGDRNAAGLTGLRLGLRNPRLPGELSEQNLAVVSDPLLRSVHEANLPAPLAGNDDHEPLVEVLCGGTDGEPLRAVPMGETVKLPFSLRDSCRVVFRRGRLPLEFGAQRIRFEMDVLTVDGGTRGEAHVGETLTLRPGTEPRNAFVHGVVRPFDRVAIRVAHVADDSHYLGAAEIRTGAPEAKWTIVFGTGHARLYATTAFPTGLYRLSDREHSGVLSLNFGLLSRLTWLDDEGQEGFLGLEAGLVVVGLGNSLENGEKLNQVGAVLGLGLSVPFANRSSSTQAAINVHAWLEIDISRDSASAADGRLAFIFGPSISIGNLGTNL